MTQPIAVGAGRTLLRDRRGIDGDTGVSFLSPCRFAGIICA